MSATAPPPTLSPAALAAAGRGLEPGFRLVLEATATGAEFVLECREVLRLLPGRRLVARVETAGSSAVLKLFLGPGARRYCERERRGCRLLAEAGVATPALLEELRGPAGSALPAHGLLLEYLPGARPLSARDDPEIAAAAAELGRLHEHGCRHRDLHLDNFLLAGGLRPYVIDGDAVRRRGRRPLSWPRSRDDLAVFCAQRPALADTRLDRVLEGYGRGRGWPADAAGRRLASLADAVRRQRRSRLRRYLHKCQRDCSEFLCRRGFRRYLVAVRSQWDDQLEALVMDPERAFADAEVLKAGNSATVVRVRRGGRSWVVKRYNVKSPWHALRRNLRGMPRFRLAWVNGQRLHMLEIPTARPVALVERRFGPLRGIAYLIMTDLGGVDLAAEVASVGLSDERLAQLVTLFLALQAAELSHGDTKATNFLVSEGQVRLVDLDAMREGARGLARDASRFLANFDHLPEVRKRLRDALAAAGVAFRD